MRAIARSELIQIFRDRLILVPGLAIPVVVSTYFAYQHEVFSDLVSLGYIAVIVLFTVMVFRIYTAAATTVAPRRQNLLLRRLRSTAASETDILTGLVLPIIVIALMQVAAILTVFAMPSHRRSLDVDLGVAP